jgi:hypothetical protein
MDKLFLDDYSDQVEFWQRFLRQRRQDFFLAPLPEKANAAPIGG